jgi:ATP-dependent helicase/nuclease subunit B
VREFESLVRATRFEPRSAPAPITVIDAHAIEELQFDALWVTGMDETRWPPPATPDPFIPLSLQVRAGMPGANATLTREQSRRRFDALRRGADTVVMSWAQHDKDVEVLPSPWLRELSDLQPATATNTTHRYAERIFAAKPSMEVLFEARAPALWNAKARGGSRIFELQAQCPFRAYAELRLDAKPLNEVIPNVDARQRGTLLHAALADIWGALKDSIGLHAQTALQLETLVRTSLARHAAPLLDGASPHRVRMLQIEQELAAERIVALLNVDKTRSDFKVVGRPETPEQLSIGGLNFELRLDRVDELLADHGGGRIIIDYKTGIVSTTSWLRERPEQPQLPLYAATHPSSLAAVAFATLGAHGVGYQGVAMDNGVLPNVKAFDKDLPPPHTGWNGLQMYWQDVVARLANQFVRGEAQVDPLPTACRHCHLSTLCRVHERKRSDDEEVA